LRFASDAMTVSDEYRVKAAEFRAKADSQRDPLFRSMFETLSKTYSRLARYHERDYRPKLAFRPSPSIAEGGELFTFLNQDRERFSN
jgi:hypothetical protein